MNLLIAETTRWPHTLPKAATASLSGCWGTRRARKFQPSGPRRREMALMPAR